MKNKSDQTYYVYVYIDPRNFEEFYYGKGKGSRKEAHLSDDSDSEKVRRIKDIKKTGLEPIIKVIAKDLTEHDAFLVEKTLIWKLGRTLANISSGSFADNFRPHNNLHRDLKDFDFRNGIYYVNVGQDRTRHRVWEDCLKYGFLAAGGKKWSDPLRTLNQGDIVVAYLKNHGYVGIGKVVAEAVPVDQFRYNGKSLSNLPLESVSLLRELGDTEKCDWLVKVEWIKAVDAKQAKWKNKSGLFTTPSVKASLQDQPETIAFLQKEFGISFGNLMEK